MDALPLSSTRIRGPFAYAYAWSERRGTAKARNGLSLYSRQHIRRLVGVRSHPCFRLHHATTTPLVQRFGKTGFESSDARCRQVGDWKTRHPFALRLAPSSPVERGCEQGLGSVRENVQYPIGRPPVTGALQCPSVAKPPSTPVQVGPQPRRSSSARPARVAEFLGGQAAITHDSYIAMYDAVSAGQVRFYPLHLSAPACKRTVHVITKSPRHQVIFAGGLHALRCHRAAFCVLRFDGVSIGRWGRI